MPRLLAPSTSWKGTVKAHVSSILIKLDARNRVQAAILAYEAGLA